MPVSDEAWRFSVGGGVFYRPEYPGSGDMEFTAVPLASANYGRFFLGGTPAAGTPLGIGAFLIRNEAWRAASRVDHKVYKRPLASLQKRLVNLDGVLEENVGVFHSVKQHHRPLEVLGELGQRVLIEVLRFADTRLAYYTA